MANQYVVMNIRYFIEYFGPVFGKGEQLIPVDVRGVTILVIENGKVVRHIDYIDYGAVLKQVEESGGPGRIHSRLRLPCHLSIFPLFCG